MITLWSGFETYQKSFELYQKVPLCEWQETFKPRNLESNINCYHLLSWA